MTMPETPRAIAPSQAPLGDSHQGLSVGDGIAVVALLAFVIGWMLFMTYDYEPSSDPSTSDTWGAVVYIAIICAPALWAGGLVTYIVRRNHA